MGGIPTFFVPAAAPENQEEVYAGFAEWCRKPVPPPQRRVYQIVWVHDGEEWTATVGEHLHGVKLRRRRGRGPVERGAPVTDPAIVLAIFADAPYTVITNARISGATSQWVNPFMAGEPRSVIYFAAT